jgi:transcriptional regulator PpsR
LFEGLDAATSSILLRAAADVLLRLDAQGTIRAVHCAADNALSSVSANWVDMAWVDTVTPESRPKLDALMRDAASVDSPDLRWREVNHPVPAGADIPVHYSSVPAGNGAMLLVGRSMQATAELQRRLVDAQQSLERDYARLRHAEARYRLLFQVATEGVLIVDAASRKVIEVNPAALQLLDISQARLVGHSLLDMFDTESADALLSVLARVRTSGRHEETLVRSADGKFRFALVVSLFRQEGNALFLVWLTPKAAHDARVEVQHHRVRLEDVVQHSPDAIVVTRLDGRVVAANRAFIEMVDAVTEEQVRGQSIEQWLGRGLVDTSVLLGHLRKHTPVRQFATTLRSLYGVTIPVEISAGVSSEGDTPLAGFTIRDVGRRMSATDGGVTPIHGGMSRAAAQLTELVGRVPLRDIVGQTTDLIEKLCIEAALQLTRDNRAAAAEMLGLSRQSLYIKLRRFGLGELGPADALEEGEPPDRTSG